MFEDYWSVTSAFLVFLLGALLVVKISSFFKLAAKRGMLIYLWHSVFCLVYLFYVLNNGGDAVAYYNKALVGRFDFNFGTAAVDGLTSLLVHGLGFNMLSCFLLFNIFGSVGLLAFDGSLKHATQFKSKFLKRLATLIIFLPSVSFWSSAIGKDAISFLAVGLAMWSALQLNKRVWLMVLSISLMLAVRPHMAGMIVIGLALSIMFDKKTNIVRRLGLGIIAMIGAAVMIPFALQYAGVSDPSSAEAIMDYVENRQSYNMEGGGGVDISSMSLPMQLFTYMFRPLIFEAHSVTALAAALDNLVLLYLFIVGGYALVMKKARKFTENRKFMWVYAGLAWLVLAMTSANLGIAVRQKWMFAPMLIFLLISLIGKEKKSVIVPTPAAPLPRAARFK